MNDFLEKLMLIRSGFFMRMKFLFVLDMLTFFSIFYAIFIIINLEYFLARSTLYLPLLVNIAPPLTAFILAAVLALLVHKKDSRINVALLIESKYPELKEKLRTAYDNRSETNEIVESLKSQVDEALKNVSASQILSSGKMLSKILIAIIFLSGLFTISSEPGKYSIPVETIKNITDTLTGTTEKGTNESIEVLGRPEGLEQAGEDGGGNIFGKPKIATIEGKNVDLSISSGTEAGYTVKEASQKPNQFIKSGVFPVDALGANVSDSGYSILMKKTETEKQLINKYAVERSKI